MAAAHDHDEDDGSDGELREKIPFKDSRVGALLLILVEGFQGLAAALMGLPALVMGFFRRGERDEEEEEAPRENPLSRLLTLVRWLLLGDEEALAERGGHARLIRMALGIGGLLLALGVIAGLVWGGVRLVSGLGQMEAPPVAVAPPSSQEVADGTQPPVPGEAAAQGGAAGAAVPGGSGVLGREGTATPPQGAPPGKEKKKREKKGLREQAAQNAKPAQAGAPEAPWQARVADEGSLEAEKGWDPVQLVVLEELQVGKDVRGARRLFGVIANRSVREATRVELAVHLTDENGKDAEVVRFNPLVVSGGLFGDRSIPVAPKQIRKFSFPLVRVPPQWSGQVRGEIVGADLKDK